MKLIELTPREAQVARLIAVGKRNQEIADELGISIETVRNYTVWISSKWAVHNRTQIAVLAANNLIPLEEAQQAIKNPVASVD